MKKVLLAILLPFLMVGCNKEPEPETKVSLNVYAAASLTESMNAIIEKCKTAMPNVEIKANYGSSGALLTQIQNGADADLFLSAAQKQMNTLDTAGFLLENSRINLLENQVALVVPTANPYHIEGFTDLVSVLQNPPEGFLLGLGGEGVPVGQYSSQILTHYGINEKELADSSHIAYGSDVKAVTSYVTNGTVAAGLIYKTDAYSANLTVKDVATSDMCDQVIYPAAVLKNSAHTSEASALLNYLRTAPAMAEFEKVGFKGLNKLA